MAITKSYTREVHDSGRVDAVETLTSTGEASNYGVSILTPGSTTTPNQYTIAAPGVQGLRKTLALTSTTGEALVIATTSVTIGGSSDGQAVSPAELVATSASNWVVIIQGTT